VNVWGKCLLDIGGGLAGVWLGGYLSRYLTRHPYLTIVLSLCLVVMACLLLPYASSPALLRANKLWSP